MKKKINITRFEDVPIKILVGMLEDILKDINVKYKKEQVAYRNGYDRRDSINIGSYDEFFLSYTIDAEKEMFNYINYLYNNKRNNYSHLKICFDKTTQEEIDECMLIFNESIQKEIQDKKLLPSEYVNWFNSTWGYSIGDVKLSEDDLNYGEDDYSYGEDDYSYDEDDEE